MRYTSSNKNFKQILAIDIGGTKISIAVFSKAGEMLFEKKEYLDGRSGQQVGNLLLDFIRSVFPYLSLDDDTLLPIGICVPGISYKDTGTVWAPNIPGWTNYPLFDEVSSVFVHQNIELTIEDDRTCYILGENWKGEAIGCQNALFIAVGTGIGAGILINGQVYKGAHGSAGAIGWLALSQTYNDAYKHCGNFEYHASGPGIERKFNNLTSLSHDETVVKSTEEIFRAYNDGDSQAFIIIHEAIKYWGMAVANLVSIFDPEMIIFGGGVFGPAGQFLEEIMAEARLWVQPVSIQKVRIKKSILGNSVGLYGAARAVLLYSSLSESPN